MDLNRGMIVAAHTEGEVASVMAHELSHVALRHGSAQASKATKYEIGALLGAVVGSIILLAIYRFTIGRTAGRTATR